MKTILSTILIFWSILAISQTAWINEFHYDNDGIDQNEMIEIVLQDYQNYNLSTLNINLLNGTNNTVYGTISLSEFTLGDTIFGYGFFYFMYPKNGLQNGPDAIELTYNGIRIDIAGYENYIENDSTYHVGKETSSTPIGFSLQIGDTTWINDTASPGTINLSQWLYDLPEDTLFAYQDSIQKRICFLYGHTWTPEPILTEGPWYNVGYMDIHTAYIPCHNTWVNYTYTGINIHFCMICGTIDTVWINYLFPLEYDSIIINSYSCDTASYMQWPENYNIPSEDYNDWPNQSWYQRWEVQP